MFWPLTPLQWYASIAMYFCLQVGGIGIGLHRYYAHRSFDTSRGYQVLLTLISTLACVGSPIAWSGIHREHHLSADRTGDPHSPRLRSWLSIWSGTWYTDAGFSARLVKDLAQDPVVRWFHRNYVIVHLLYSILLLLIGPTWWVALYAVPVVMVYHVTSLGVIFNHVIGYRRHATSDASTNNILISLLTLGEGWHNNHHAHPSTVSQGETWWEFDVPALIIDHVLAKKMRS